MINRLKWGFFVLFMLFFTQTIMAQDWGNLKRYQKKNAALMASGFDENRIVFMGNSITQGWSDMRPAFFDGKCYVNRGIGGQTTPEMLLRFRQDVINLKPKAVVLLAGINDIAGNRGPSTTEIIYNNIISMVEWAGANEIQVILCSVLPVFDFPWNPGVKPALKVIELNGLLKAYANKHGILYLDYFTAMVDDSNGLKKELGIDGVHPNEAGYAVMEPLLEKAIASLKK
ncbi:MAG: Acylhydrolase [uncultured Aureispira sp.]|uniref:Acylhydrolase n=1 Tax=uncultured Aureispira sp. TaxID=1331704 RepID=A0A6S6T1F8_9BACT|nr:MAG: Acylhydrolase [uncultured Aureispira sp.]